MIARLVLVQVLDEGRDAAVVLELVLLAVALVVNRDEDAGVEERQFAQALRQRVEAVLDRFENLRVRPERHLRAATLRRSRHFEIGERMAALVTLLVDLAVPPDLEVEPLGQRVDDGDANAMEAARHLVALVVELAASVEHGEHDFGRRLAARVAIDRESRARCRRR